jgi:RNA polymerase-interacting CarD/CdnL/TRCF family regulator
MLQIRDKDLVVDVPVDSAETVGLRTVFNQAEIEAV